MYSYEQFICAMFANNKSTIGLGEINKAIMAFKEGRKDFGLVAQNIMYINKYIDFNNHLISLKGNLEDNVNCDGVIMSLEDFFKMIAGEELIGFMDSYLMGHSAKRN